ncbi:MAG: ClpXP protease specificity-enhancing factor [bacterium]
MTSNRPYLIRALFDWIVDNDLTPHMLVDATQPDVMVPSQFVEDGRIVLNISPTAVDLLNLGNDVVTFNARFAGQATDIYIPIPAVLGVYARENGQGMLFPDDEGAEPPPTDPAPPEDRKPKLTVVK